MWHALADISRGMPGDVRVVVIRGEGPTFSSGLDRAMFTPEGVPGAPKFADIAALSHDQMDAAIAGYQSAFRWWERPDIVSIAAVQGHAIGAGFQLALACDLRVLADDAQFAIAEPSLGLVPDLGGTGALADLVGYARALEICITGRRVSAHEAHAIGLATAVVPIAELEGAVGDLAAAILAAPRDAVIETKALLVQARDRSRHEQLAAERAAQGRRLRDLAGLGE